MSKWFDNVLRSLSRITFWEWLFALAYVVPISGEQFGHYVISTHDIFALTFLGVAAILRRISDVYEVLKGEVSKP